jgi:hypothetical protein
MGTPPNSHPSWRRPRRGLPFVRAKQAIGDLITVRGQDYLLVGTEPHTRKDGSKTKLAIWQSDCAECGAVFECRSPIIAPPQTRRCDEHKRPGVWVRKPSAEPQDERKSEPIQNREAQ